MPSYLQNNIGVKVPVLKVINIEISKVGYNACINAIIEQALLNERGYYCFTNAHMCVEATDPEFAMQVNNSTMSVSDGMSLVMALRILYGVKQERIAGMDVIESILKSAGDYPLKIFILGGLSSTHALFIEKSNKLYPHVRIAGVISPPMGSIDSYDNDSFIEIINNSGANLVFVCLGCPKQEKWMAMFSSKINAVLLGLGGALPVFAGQVTRAPGWMQRSGLEWLYRLIKEPKRLWKRYFYTNSLFIWKIFKQKVKM